MSVIELFPSKPAAYIEATATTRRDMNHYVVVAVFHDDSRELIWSGPWRDEANRQIRRAKDQYQASEVRVIREADSR